MFSKEIRAYKKSIHNLQTVYSKPKKIDLLKNP